MDSTTEYQDAKGSEARRLLVLFGAGLLLGVSFPGFVPGSSPLIACLAWGAPLPWFYLVGRSGSGRLDFDRSQAFSLGSQILLASWVLALFPSNGLLPSSVSSALVVGLAWLGMALFYSLAFAFAGLAYGALVRAYLRADGPSWGLPLLAGSFWAVFEWIGTLGSLANPWATLATTQVANLPFLQLLPLGGPYLLGGVMAAFACAMAEALRAWRQHRPVPRTALAIALLVALCGAYGALALRPTPPGGFKAAAVQGNYERAVKWNPAMLHRMASRYLELSAQAADAQLVAWPETPLPVYWNEPVAKPEIARIKAAFAAPGRYLLTGGFFRSDGGSSERGRITYNAATVLGTGHEDWPIEPKRHLAPLGEFLPLRGLAPRFLAKLNMLGHDLTPGPSGQPLVTPLATFGVGICFDAYFPRALADDTRAGASVLAVLANDDWLQKTFAPRLSFANAVLRAAENHRFLIRIGNTGITAFVDPYGRVLDSAPPFRQTVLTGRVAPLHDLTPYTRLGDWPVWLGGLLLGGGAVFALRRRGLAGEPG